VSITIFRSEGVLCTEVRWKCTDGCNEFRYLRRCQSATVCMPFMRQRHPYHIEREVWSHLLATF
jgi:hypothetical protein